MAWGASGRVSHGKYPVKDLGQTLYAWFEGFKEIVEVYKQDGRTVPVFNGKHPSWKWEWSKEMVDTAHVMGFPLLVQDLPCRLPGAGPAQGPDLWSRGPDGSHRALPSAAWTATISTPWRPSSAWWNAAGAVRPECDWLHVNAGGSTLGSHGGQGLLRWLMLGPATLHHLPLPHLTLDPGRDPDPPLPNTGCRGMWIKEPVVGPFPIRRWTESSP